MSLRIFFKIFKKDYASNDKNYSDYYYTPQPHFYTSLSGGINLNPTINITKAISPPITAETQSILSLPKILPKATVVARYLDKSKNTLPASFRLSLFTKGLYHTGGLR